MKIKSIILILSGICILGSVPSCRNINNNSSNSNSTNENNSNDSNDIVIHFAVSGDSEQISKAVKNFNSSNNGYCVELVYYQQEDRFEDDSLQLADFDLIQDIMNTTNIDVITSCCFTEEANYKNLQDKNAFIDLYKFMETDDEINSDTLNSHVLKLNESEGKLFSIPTFFSAYSVGGNPEYVGTKKNWTIEEMENHWEQMPANATFQGGKTKEWVYSQILRDNLVNFVDQTAGTVSFDSEDFKKGLEFCNSFEYGYGEKTIFDYEAPVFCSPLFIKSYMNIASFNLGGISPKITFVGFPSSDENGAYLRGYGDCFSILSRSDVKKQEGAWLFIRTFFSEEWQEENVMSYSDVSKGYASQNAFCMNNKALENIKNKTVEKSFSPDSYESKGQTINVEFPTLGDCDALDEYLNSINRWETRGYENVNTIVQEEVYAYFADEINIDECIRRIQNRTAIWINEKK